jgi:hypothetical protein
MGLSQHHCLQHVTVNNISYLHNPDETEITKYPVRNLVHRILFWHPVCKTQWPNSLKRESATACLLGLRVRIPPRTWISVNVVCCQRSLGRADPSSRGVLPSVACLHRDRVASTVRGPRPTGGWRAMGRNVCNLCISLLISTTCA